MSTGSDTKGGSVDFLESNPSVAPSGVTRLARKGGSLLASTDGSAFAALGGNTILARANALVPTGLFDTVLGTDFDAASWYTSAVSNGGTVVQSVTLKGSVVTLSSLTTGNATAVFAPNGGGAVIDNARTSPWYFYARVLLGTADANAGAFTGIGAIAGGQATSPLIAIGINGGVSTTNVSWRVTNGGGSTVASGTGPVLDSNWHTVEAYNDGTTLTVLFDAASIGSTAATNVSAVPKTLYAVALNGATAANRTISIDKMWFACLGN